MYMKRVFVNLIPVFLTVYLFAGSAAFAQQQWTYDPKALNTITTAVPFLMIGPDARAGGLGDAGVSSTPDANSMHWNPSKYAFIDKDMGFSISYVPWLRALVNDIGLAYLSGFKKVGPGQTLAASLLYFSLGDITFTDNVGNNVGTYKPNEFSVDMCYSRKFSDLFSGGVALRYIHSNLTGGTYVGGTTESHAGNSIATDVSAYYQDKVEFGKTPAKIAVGINISNIGAKMAYTETTKRDFIPINLRIGPTLTIDLDDYNSLSILFDINKLLVPTQPVYKLDANNLPVIGPNGDPEILAGHSTDVSIVSGMLQSFGDAPGGFREEIKEFNFSPGLEYWYDKQFALRGGFFWEAKSKGNRKYFTLGAGIKYNVFDLDFAYLIPIETRNPLQNTLRFTLLFNFDAIKEQDKKTK
jgi:hypothetical protein